MHNEMSRDAANCAAPWWECENDLVASIEDDIAINAFEIDESENENGL
jgi:hypothetical protein